MKLPYSVTAQQPGNHTVYVAKECETREVALEYIRKMEVIDSTIIYKVVDNLLT